jgi:predicted transcriptional regulator
MDASENGTKIAIIPAQVRAARSLLNISQDDLAAASEVPKRTLVRLELGQGEPQSRTVVAVREALEAAGVVFIAENGGGAGVRLRDRSSPQDG